MCNFTLNFNNTPSCVVGKPLKKIQLTCLFLCTFDKIVTNKLYILKWTKTQLLD